LRPPAQNLQAKILDDNGRNGF